MALSTILEVSDQNTAPHIETRSVRLNAKPRICEQAYGQPYFKMICSDGTIAILVNAPEHRELAKLDIGSEIQLKGRWTFSRLHETYRDQVFHIEALVS